MNFQPATFFRSPSVWAILPVKRLADSKRRLAGVLTPSQRTDLMWRLVRHSLATLKQCPGIDQVLVISGDEDVLTTAVRQGAITINEGGSNGLNPAVTRAVNFAAHQGATAVLILPVDLPFLRPDDVAQVLARQGNDRTTIVIASDRRSDGTNALLLPVPTTFRFHYGPGSYHQHLQEAARLGMIAHTAFTPGVQFDLDTKQDWQNYQMVNNEELTVGIHNVQIERYEQ
ncbi:MAG: 2-phospho-L-lactate guanylyltransferase [Anaerolineae bacterium]